MKIANMQGFIQKYKRIIYSINMVIKSNFKGKLGRKFKVNLIEQISITIFKLKYNLPDRILEDIFRVDHVTISRIINRISLYLSKFNLSPTDKSEFYIVDSTTIRRGKGKNSDTYSGYKHHHGVKFQVIINENLSILGDKAYVPIKRNELEYKKYKIKVKSLNKKLSSKRIKIEHLFAKMKNFRILQRLNYYKINKIEIFFNAIANIYNLSKI